MIDVDAVEVRTRRQTLLGPTSLVLREGERRLWSAPPGDAHAALALVLGGRMRPSSGQVRLDGVASPEALRHAVALVDTPRVSEPDDALPVGTVVGEELALAGQAAGPRDVSAWLAEHGVESRHRQYGELDPGTRTRVLAELAATGPRVRFLVLTLPERHGGDPTDLWSLAGDLADRGYGVLLQSTDITARVLAAGLTTTPHLELL